jgi:hypothetical protein
LDRRRIERYSDDKVISFDLGADHGFSFAGVVTKLGPARNGAAFHAVIHELPASKEWQLEALAT